jgi:type III secretion system low calcium response chaperone LcrH/SycD
MNPALKEFEISKKVSEKIKDKQLLKREFSEGKNIQEILEFSEETMNKFYGAALSIFEKKEYQKAVQAFSFLAGVNPYHYDYWLGLGASIQHCHDYEAAIDAYEMAAICQIDNPVPYFHLAKCLFAMHDRNSALQAIDLAIEYSENQDQYDELHRQAKAAKETLLKEQ